MRDGILEALAQGTGVTAKISWLTNASIGGGDNNRPTSSSLEGKPRWIHCTPLLGSDEKVGVWMIVMVENEEVTGSLNAHRASDAAGMMSPTHMGAASSRFTGDKLYEEYLRREGTISANLVHRPSPHGSMNGGSQNGGASHVTSASLRERRVAENSFRDF